MCVCVNLFVCGMNQCLWKLANKSHREMFKDQQVNIIGYGLDIFQILIYSKSRPTERKLMKDGDNQSVLCFSKQPHRYDLSYHLKLLAWTKINYIAFILV